jgi:outer membrane protein assembly factor BamD (BamD/ComL family)
MNAMRKYLAIAFVLAASATQLQAQDIIKFRDPNKNPDMEGDVVSMSYKLIEIEINVGGTLAKQPADARLVVDVIPNGSKKDFDFAKGEESMANNDFQTAIARFEKVWGSNRATELMKQLALINIVRCQYYAGSPAGVVQAAQSLRSKKPESFYVRESFELEVKAHLATNNVAAASSAIVAFKNLANTAGMQEWAKSGELMDAGLSERKGDARAALQTYKKYSRDHDVGEDATLGEMRCLTLVKDYPSLNSRADQIIKDASGKKTVNPRLLIAAYNGKGDVEDNGGKIKESLFNYLQGAMVLGRGETSAEHEASLARASIACAKLATAEKDATKKSTYKGRAIEMFQELTRTYGANTRYKNEVDKAIKDVK